MKITIELIGFLEGIACCPIRIVEVRMDCGSANELVRMDWVHELRIEFFTEHGVFRWGIDLVSIYALGHSSAEKIIEMVLWFRSCQI